MVDVTCAGMQVPCGSKGCSGLPTYERGDKLNRCPQRRQGCVAGPHSSGGELVEASGSARGQERCALETSCGVGLGAHPRVTHDFA